MSDGTPMGMVKTIACGLVLLPVAEIIAFFVAVSLIGLARTVILLALISLAGLLVVRRVFTSRGGFKSGPDANETGKASVRNGGGPARTDQVVFASVDPPTLAGGVLLLIPGFITGLLGVLVLHGQSRHWLLRNLAGRGTARPRKSGPQPGPQVIELSPTEWKRLPERVPPPRRGPASWRHSAAGSDRRNQ